MRQFLVDFPFTGLADQPGIQFLMFGQQCTRVKVFAAVCAVRHMYLHEQQPLLGPLVHALRPVLQLALVVGGGSGGRTLRAARAARDDRRKRGRTNNLKLRNHHLEEPEV